MPRNGPSAIRRSSCGRRCNAMSRPGAAAAGPPPCLQFQREEAARRLGVDLHAGLTGDEVRQRREQYGANEIREGKRRGPLAMFLGQFTDFMILVLLGAAVVSGMIGDVVDTLGIVAVGGLRA